MLDADHSGLEKAKDRILEYLAVRKLNPDVKGPILCFVGPPGVGKTSLARSIAESLGRKFVRVSLGGMRDEAEIRGHRRTYIGALPGQIIQGLRRAESKNPVFILDEIDKLGSDFRGDPSSALLEVLDPEQNNTFRDHYLDVPFDLSEVLFITTANVLDPIPAALRDRMEVLEIAGYTEEEKLKIATDHLVDKQVEEPRPDAGVHHASRRRAAAGDSRLHARGRRPQSRARDRRALPQGRAAARRRQRDADRDHARRGRSRLLGAPQFLDEEMEERTKDPGVAIGLAWTPVGGEVLFIEASRMAGTGSLTLTGQLGDVMKESARAALSWLRAHADDLRHRSGLLQERRDARPRAGRRDPEGRTVGRRDDGDGAGVGADRPAGARRPRDDRRDHAVRAACCRSAASRRRCSRRGALGIHEVILPKQNAKNINEDLTPELREGLTVHLVSTIDEVLALALQPVASDVRPARKPARPVGQVGRARAIERSSTRPGIASISGRTSFPRSSTR